MLLPTRDGIFARVKPPKSPIASIRTAPYQRKFDGSMEVPLRDTPAEQKPEPKAQEPIVLPAIDAQSHWVTEVAPVWVAAGEPK